MPIVAICSFFKPPNRRFILPLYISCLLLYSIILRPEHVQTPRSRSLPSPTSATDQERASCASNGKALIRTTVNFMATAEAMLKTAAVKNSCGRLLATLL